MQNSTFAPGWVCAEGVREVSRKSLAPIRAPERMFGRPACARLPRVAHNDLYIDRMEPRQYCGLRSERRTAHPPARKCGKHPHNLAARRRTMCVHARVGCMEHTRSSIYMLMGLLGPHHLHSESTIASRTCLAEGSGRMTAPAFTSKPHTYATAGRPTSAQRATGTRSSIQRMGGRIISPRSWVLMMALRAMNTHWRCRRALISTTNPRGH